MRETDIFGYFLFGYNYYLLRFFHENKPVHKGEDSLINRLKEFFDYLNELDLQVTRMAAGDLINIFEKVKKLPEDAEVDTALAKEVHTAVNKLDATLDAELQLRSAYIVTPKRFPLEYLLKNPGRIFASGTFQKLLDLCKYDFREACLCIAYKRPTAAAFHIMRGTEGVLRGYYCSIIKRSRIKPLLWKNMVEHLVKRRDAPLKPLMDNLDNIRVNFRNPTQHPEARYDMDGAQDLLSISIDVVNRMIKDLDDRGLSHLEPF